MSWGCVAEVGGADRNFVGVGHRNGMLIKCARAAGLTSERGRLLASYINMEYYFYTYRDAQGICCRHVGIDYST